MKDQRIKVGEIELQVREYPHEGEAIIFLHFSGSNMLMWDGVVPFFQDKYHLILFDLKGHGRSDKPKTGYNKDELAQEVIQAVDQLGVNSFHIIGSSMGVEVGLSIAANHPDRVLSLVCDGGMFNESGPYGLWEGTEEEFQAHALERVEKLRTTPPTTYPTVDEMIEASRKVFEEYGWWSDGYEAVKRYDAVQLPDGTFTSSWGHIAEDYTKYYLHNHLEDYYSTLKCPVLMLPDTYPGQDDREKEIMHAMFKMAGKGKIVAVPEWVHPFGWMITPEAVSQVILEFLSEVNSM